jgi:hypothetical protein
VLKVKNDSTETFFLIFYYFNLSKIYFMTHTKQNNLNLKFILLLLFFISLNSTNGNSQVLFNCTLANLQYPTPTTLEFDLMLSSSSAVTCKLAGFQAGIEVDYNAIANGGVLTASWVPGSSDALLPSGYTNLSQNVLTNLGPALTGSGYRQIRMTAMIITSSSLSIPLTATPKRYARIRLTNTGSTFNPSVNPKFIWSFQPSTFRTRTNLIVHQGSSTISTNATTQSSGGTPNITNPTAAYNYIAGPEFFVDNNPYCPGFLPGPVVDPLCYGSTGSASFDANLPTSGTYQVDGGTVQFFSTTNTVTISGLSQGSHSIALQASGASCSTYVYNVTIGGPTSPATNTTNITACGTYTWPVNGATYTSSGQYTATGTNSAGCPTDEILNLTITNNTVYTTNVQTCGSYVWPVNGTTYTASGTYNDTSSNQSSCLNINQLNLTILPIPVVTAPQVASCSNVVLLGGSPAGGTWNLANPYSGNATTYTYFYTNANGCTGSATGSISLQSNTISNIQVNAYNTGSSAYMTWSGNGTWFECRYKTLSSNNWITSTSTTPMKAIQGLTPSTTYTVQIRGFCSGNASSAGAWFGTSFTSGAGCPVPTGISTSTLTATTVNLTWGAVPGAQYYKTYYRKVGNQNWVSGTSNVNNKAIVGLLPSSNYEFKVQTVCVPIANSSLMSAVYSFTTPVLKEIQEQEEPITEAIRVYPNPATDLLHADIPLKEYTMLAMQIVDMSGRVIKRIQLEGEPGLNTLSSDISDLMQGVYVVQLVSNEQLLYTTRVIKK